MKAGSQEGLSVERRTTIPTKQLFPTLSLKQRERLILSSLDRLKAVSPVSIDITGKSDFADRMIVASGTSARHVASIADAVVKALKEAGQDSVSTEGKDVCDWVLVDAGDVIVHLFHPDIREHYNLEKMWSVSVPASLEAVL